MLAFDASADTTDVYPFTLTVRNHYDGTAEDTTVSGTLIIVNRSTSEFGAGWWLAGVEQLVTDLPSGEILWMGGEGSVKLYAPAGTDTWVAPAGAYRDTLRLDPAIGVFTRTLRHGIQVRFDLAGQHVETVNRAGHKTTFTWSGSPARLTSIQVPPAGVPGTTYTLAYDAGGYLDRITDPPNRVLDATVTGERLTALVDPDLHGPSFAYDSVGRMIGRTTRRGFQTRFEYGNDLRVTRVKVPLDTLPGDTAVTDFQPWDEKGLGVGLGAAGGAAVDTALAFTTILGPRPNVADDATFWVDRWGAPTKIVDPIGATTTIARNDPAVPALVTEVHYPNDQGSPNGRIVKMTWNARGNLTEMRDSTRHLDDLPTAVTTWTYNDPNTQDSPDQVIDPEGVITRFAYNAMGLTREVTAPNGHVTKFEYTTGSVFKGGGDPRGLLRAVTEQGVLVFDSAQNTEVLASPRHAFGYDTLGNLTSDTSALGHVRRFERDSLERVRYFYDAGGHLTEFQYDVLNRLFRTFQHVEGVDSGYTAPLVTTQVYDIDVLTSITDPRSVVRAYEYDAAGRQTAEIDDYGNREIRHYNEAGLIDSVRTRSNDLIRYEYDAAGRVRKKAWNARVYVRDNTTVTIPSDSILYEYDAMGSFTSAISRRWRLDRDYYANGLLRREVQADTNGVRPSRHEYAYDRAGRRIWYRIGPATAAHDSVWYSYETTGAKDLSAIGVLWRSGVRDSVRFRWDELGRRDSVVYTNGVRVGFAYDANGRFRRLCSQDASSSISVFRLRVLREWVDPDGLVRRLSTGGDATCPSNHPLVQTNTYDSRHQLLDQTEGTTAVRRYRYDGSGNQISARIVGPGNFDLDKRFEIEPEHNRVTRYWLHYADAPYYDIRPFYDADGNRLDEVPHKNGQPRYDSGDRRIFWTDALGRLSGFGYYEYDSGTSTGWVGRWNGEEDGGQSVVEDTIFWQQLTWINLPTNCTYDPLGRLMSGCENGAPGRFSYDGDNVVRMGHDDAAFRFTIVHGPGLDDPIMGHRPLAGDHYVYFLTDGQGRQYATGFPDGTDYTSEVYYQNEARYAGGITDAEGFSANRFPGPATVGLSFFRNRFYDQNTGRWLQEDPIGLAGGLNLYAYAGNSPVNFTDPFGLKVCADTKELREGVEEAVNATIEWDDEGCVSDLEKVTFHDPYEWALTQGTFSAMVTSNETWSAAWGSKDDPTTISPVGCPQGRCSNFNSGTRTAFIFREDIGTASYRRCGLLGALGFRGRYRTTGAMISHELISHGRGSMNKRNSHGYFMFWAAENEYHAAHGEPRACP